MTKMRAIVLGSVAAMLSAGSVNAATVAITEWAYQGNDGEFIEITNVTNGPIDLAGWSFDDDSRNPGVVSLSSFGILQAGESAIITEAGAATFRTAWNLAETVKVLGGNGTNLGRNDEINIFDASNQLVDRFAFGDQNFPGSLRTQGISGNVPLVAIGLDDVLQAEESYVGDVYGSWSSVAGDIGNPGSYSPIPEPTSLSLLALGGAAMLRRRRV